MFPLVTTAFTIGKKEKQSLIEKRGSLMINYLQMKHSVPNITNNLKKPLHRNHTSTIAMWEDFKNEIKLNAIERSRVLCKSEKQKRKQSTIRTRLLPSSY